MCWAEPWWSDRCVSASRFLPPGALSLSQLPSRHAPDTNRHLAIAHNPLPSNNHLSQIHLRPRAGSTLITLLSTPLGSLSSPTTDHFLIPRNYLRDDKVSPFPFFLPGNAPSPPPHCVPCRPSHLRYGRFSAGKYIIFSGDLNAAPGNDGARKNT